MILKNLTIYAEHGIISSGWIEITEGKIVAMGEGTPLHPSIEDVDLTGNFLLPGFIDQHIHGALGADFMDGTPEAIETILSYLPQEGVTSVLATTMTEDIPTLKKALHTLGTFQNPFPMTKLLGIHLEGPFISKGQKGAQNEAFILPPQIDLMAQLYAASHEQIKLITYAPEMDEDGTFLSYLNDHHIIPSIGHTSADMATCLKAIHRGAQQFTHLYNAMSPLHHRQPGAVAAALFPTSAGVELIADGIHVSPDMLNFTFRLKGASHITLISDAIRAKGMGPGTYQLGGQAVTVTGQQARLNGGTLAGSILRYEDGAKRMRQVTGCSLQDLTLMTSLNPAKRLGLDHEIGSIKVGKKADLVVITPEMEVMMTLVDGVVAYRYDLPYGSC